MQTSALIDTLSAEGESLADTAEGIELTAAVPTCPGWTLRDLLLHVGGVHRWADTLVRERRAEPIVVEQPYDIVEELPDDEELVAWFRAGHADLVRTLRAAPADVACWSFLPAPSPLAFWARRQAHETTVHRVDADTAGGRAASPIEPAAAVDGIDELLTCFVANRARRLRDRTGWTLAVRATDADARWLVRVGPELPQAERVDKDETADLTVTGPAAGLYLALWNRRPWDGLTVTGLPAGELADRWASGVHVSWS